MNSLLPLYIVPFDFTEVSEHALHIAFQLAEKNDRQVYLLHVAKSQHTKIAARKNFEERVAKMTDAEKKRVTTKVIIGDVFNDLAKAGDLLNASMIVMGTHGAKGFQKLFGSNAEKVISHASVPVLIVRENENLEAFKTIVMPFSFEKETIQVLRYAAVLAKEMNSTIHLVSQHKSDEFLAGHLRVNQSVARTFLNEQNIAHEVVNLPSKKSYQKELMAYAVDVKAGLIAATYFKDGILPVPNSFIQEMIENKEVIPLLTINADEISVASSVLSFMTNWKFWTSGMNHPNPRFELNEVLLSDEFRLKMQQQIVKDFAQVELCFLEKFEKEVLSKEEILENMANALATLMERGERHLLQLLYTVDLPENLFLSLTTKPDFLEKLSEQILQREAYKVYLRKIFSS